MVVLTITAGQAWALTGMAIVNKTVTRGMYIYTACVTAIAVVLGVTFALVTAQLDIRRQVLKQNPLIGATLVPVYHDDNTTVKGFVVAGQNYDAADIRPYNPVVDSTTNILPQ